MKNTLMIFATAVLLALGFPVAMSSTAFAQDSAGQQLNDANDSGQDAVNSSTDEEASDNARKVFDTPADTTVVDTTSPSEGSSGLENAPTYNEGSGSGLSNAPTP